MSEFTPNPLWLFGFAALIIICIVVALLHNRASKSDRVNRTERDTIADSVSITPPDKKRKND